MAKKDKPPVDHIEANERALERLVEIAENAEFSSGTLVGDIRDGMLNLFKARQKPWSQLSEIEQRDTAKGLENIAKAFVRKTVLVVAQEDKVTVDGVLKGYSGKGGAFSLKIEAQGDEATALELFKMDGHPVVIISADADKFVGQKGDVQTDADQPALKFEGDANANAGEPSSETKDLAGDEDEELEPEPVGDDEGQSDGQLTN